MLFLNGSFLIASHIKFGRHLYNNDYYLYLALGLNVIWVFILFSSRLHNPIREQTLSEQINRVLTSLVIYLSIVLTLWFVLEPFAFSRQQLFITFIFFSGSAVLWRIGWFYFIRYYRSKGYNIRNVVVIGYEDMAEKMISYMNEHPSLGYRLVGVFDDQNDESSKFQGVIDKVHDFVSKENVDIFFCNLNSLAKSRVQELINLADSNLIKVKMLSTFSRLEMENISVQNYGQIPVLNINEIPLDNWLNQFIKRSFDIVFSMLMIIGILSWVLLIVALFIRVESRGSVFFMQKRHGKGNRPFYCWKLRTMVLNNVADSQQATKNDVRVTRVGAFLRRTSIDELPQFFNVFLGDMSVVGPRPHPIKLNEQYQPNIEKFWQRHAVKPGVTGLAQVKGFRGETDHSAMSGRVKLDRFYVRNWSLILDVKIILLTVVSFLRGSENAY